MKVIFLDVDGVLNHGKQIEKVEDDKIGLLNQIVKATNAEIVLSSDWRYWLNTDDEDVILLERKLSSVGIDIMSSTPITKHGYRGAEIYQWINEWNGEQIEKFVILDDRDDMKPYMNRLVQTSFDLGLQEKHVKRVIQLLNE